MRVALDVRPALSRPTGVGHYVLALARRLPALAPADNFCFFTASLRERWPAEAWPANVRLVDRRLPVRAMNLAWNRLRWPPLETLVRARIDVVHSPHPLLIPSRGARRIVTIHDLFFLRHPELTRREVRRDYAPLVRRHALQADAVICVSAQVGRQVQELLGVPAERVHVIPLGVEPAFREAVSLQASAAALRRLGLEPGFLLYVGSDEPRKNLAALRRAYRALAAGRPAPPLVLIGPGDAGPPGPGRVVATGYLPAAEVRALMAAARALVLPSLDEGFGLPVAEALAAGLPVVCSRLPVLQEVAGEAALYFDPQDKTSLTSALERALDDPGRLEVQRREGLNRSLRFDWGRTAADTLALYRRLLG